MSTEYPNRYVSAIILYNQCVNANTQSAPEERVARCKSSVEELMKHIVDNWSKPNCDASGIATAKWVLKLNQEQLEHELRERPGRAGDCWPLIPIKLLLRHHNVPLDAPDIPSFGKFHEMFFNVIVEGMS